MGIHFARRGQLSGQLWVGDFRLAPFPRRSSQSQLKCTVCKGKIFSFEPHGARRAFSSFPGKWAFGRLGAKVGRGPLQTRPGVGGGGPLSSRLWCHRYRYPGNRHHATLERKPQKSDPTRQPLEIAGERFPARRAEPPLVSSPRCSSLSSACFSSLSFPPSCGLSSLASLSSLSRPL